MTPSSAGKRSPVARLVESTPLRRRLVTIPSYGLAWVVTTGLAPLWLPLAALAGLLRRRSFVILRLLLFLWMYLSLALITLCAYLVITIYWGDAARREDAISRASRWYGNALFAWCVRLLSLSVVVEGDGHNLRGPLLVLVRHASIIDAALPAALMSKRKELDARYVLRKELMMDPCLDIAGHAGSHCFVDRDGPRRRELDKIGRVAEHLGEQAVVIYPEGTRFSEPKRDEAIRSLERTQPELATIAASMTHVLPPKVAGVLQLLEAAPGADCLIIAHRGVPPQNPADRTIVDVSALGVELGFPNASLAVRPARDRPIELEFAARACSREPRPSTTAGRSEAQD
jgi:1-acyl-sn-glycerol-3-phosphate acyltransferase